jgi:hypothetical protein
MSEFGRLMEWLRSGDYLPKFMRDFHDQKTVFRYMHHAYRDDENEKDMPNWVQGHCYVIDWFLWFMASRGYTLQKTRKKLSFKDLPKYRELPELSEVKDA